MYNSCKYFKEQTSQLATQITEFKNQLHDLRFVLSNKNVLIQQLEENLKEIKQ